MGTTSAMSGGANGEAAVPAKLDVHPLIGEFAFFDGSFYLGFWREQVCHLVVEQGLMQPPNPAEGCHCGGLLMVVG